MAQEQGYPLGYGFGRGHRCLPSRVSLQHAVVGLWDLWVQRVRQEARRPVCSLVATGGCRAMGAGLRARGCGGLASLLAAGEGSGPSHKSLNCVFGSGGDVNNPLK